MTSKEKKAWLQRYKKLDTMIDQKLEELARVRARCEKITTTLSDAPGGGSTTKEDTYARLVDLDAEINADVDAFVDMRREIESKIKGVQDLTLQTILSLRYIEGMTWERVAVEMNYCYKQVCRLHGAALQAISI